jgi:hypothetical protein
MGAAALPSYEYLASRRDAFPLHQNTSDGVSWVLPQIPRGETEVKRVTRKPQYGIDQIAMKTRQTFPLCDDRRILAGADFESDS